jgi:hypothetical protein
MNGETCIVLKTSISKRCIYTMHPFPLKGAGGQAKKNPPDLQGGFFNYI